MINSLSTFLELFGENSKDLPDEESDEEECDWSDSDHEEDDNDQEEEHHRLAQQPPSMACASQGTLARRAPVSGTTSAQVGDEFDSKEDAVRACRELEGKSLVQLPGSNGRRVAFRCKDGMDDVATQQARAGAKRGSYEAQKIVWKTHGCKGGAVITRINNLWRIKDITPHSNCGGQRTLSASELANVSFNKVKRNRGISSDDLGDHVIDKHPHVTLPNRRQLLRAKQEVLDELDKRYDESFSAFRRWGKDAQMCTPGATFDVVESGGVFKSAFFAWPASVFLDAVLPVVGLDGTHSRHRFFKGVYLTLTTLTSEGTILLLAFAVVASESTESWSWFLRLCDKAGLGAFFGKGRVVFSDRDKGLAASLLIVFPNAYSFHCAWHLLQNLYKVVRGDRSSLGRRGLLFWACVKALTKDEFDDAMQNLRASAPRAHEYLARLDIARWTVFGARAAGAHMHGRLTSQFSESLNAAMCKTQNSARFLPPLAFFQDAHVKIVKQIAAFRAKIDADLSFVLTARATKMLEKCIQDAAHYNVVMSSPTIAMVSDTNVHFTVGLRDEDGITKAKCPCGVYEQFEIPCPHIIAGEKKRGQFDYHDFAVTNVGSCHHRLIAKTALDQCMVCAQSILGDVLGLKPGKDDATIQPPPRRESKKGRRKKHKRMLGAYEKGKGKA